MGRIKWIVLVEDEEEGREDRRCGMVCAGGRGMIFRKYQKGLRGSEEI